MRHVLVVPIVFIRMYHVQKVYIRLWHEGLLLEMKTAS